jgi:hypothetical protein
LVDRALNLAETSDVARSNLSHMSSHLRSLSLEPSARQQHRLDDVRV